MTLEQQLDALCKKHNLESISVTRQTSTLDRSETFTCVSVRSRDGHYEVTTQGTAGEQIAHCVSLIAAKRTVGRTVAELVAAA